MTHEKITAGPLLINSVCDIPRTSNLGKMGETCPRILPHYLRSRPTFSAAWR